MILTGKPLFDTLTRNGFNAPQAMIGYAIVKAESGGDTNATHTNSDGSVDRGMWQINSTHVDSGRISASACFDAEASTRYAYQLSHGGTQWTDWSTYNNHAVNKFMGEAMNQGMVLPASPLDPIMAAVGKAIGAIFGPMFTQAGSFVVNAGLVVLGVAMLGGGALLAVMAIQQQVPSQLTKTAGRAGKAAKMARFLAAA